MCLVHHQRGHGDLVSSCSMRKAILTIMRMEERLREEGACWGWERVYRGACGLC